MIVLGGLVAYFSNNHNLMVGAFAGLTILSIGAVAVYLGLDKWYCQNCGQKLGKIKPKECGRCGSNRISTQDPGAGKAVRVKKQ